MQIQALGPLQEHWLKNLESGQFNQTRCRLHDKHGYCCLGVALEHTLNVKPLRRSTSEDEAWLYAEDKGDTNTGSDATVVAMMPQYAFNKLKLRGGVGTGKHREDGTRYEDLSILNDRRSKTFSDIAAIIRSDPSVYFTEPA